MPKSTVKFNSPPWHRFGGKFRRGGDLHRWLLRSAKGIDRWMRRGRKGYVERPRNVHMYI